MSPRRLGTAAGTLVSLCAGLVYVIGLGEPGAAWYPFALLVFLGGPVIGGAVAARTTAERRRRAFLAAASTVCGVAFLLFILIYAVLPQRARTSVQLPAFCDGYDGHLDPPAGLAHALPEAGTGILLAADAHSAVVAVIDASGPPFSSTVYLLDRSDNRVIRSLQFGNDVVSATIDGGILYLYNDKLGYLIDAERGEFMDTFLLIDNYGGLSESDRPFISRASSGHWYLETTAVISSWHVDGRVRSRPRLTFNGIARGCFIAGDSRNITKL